MEVSASGVQVLVSRAYHADELNEAEIRRGREAAREAISHGAKGDDLATAQALLRRSFIEMKVFRRRKVHAPLHTSPLQ